MGDTGIGIGTTPYKDSPLFYNLITNRSLEEMSKPTNPVAQRQIREASRRKTSTSLNISSGGVKNLTFPAPKNNSLLKDPFFDGFEEEDQGTTIDILSPKTSVKKLTLKNLRGFSRYSLNSSSSGFNTSNGPTSEDYSRGSRFNDSQSGLNNSVVDVSDVEPPQHESTVLNESINSASPSDSFYLAVNNHKVVNGNESFNDTRNDSVYEPPNNNNSNNPNNSSYDGAQNHPCGVKSTRAGYYISPDIKELDLLTDAQGNCFVRGFIVGRHNFGEIRFLDIVNVANIDIDETVLFRHKEVVVYPDDSKKPPLGEGINVPAEIRLERVWPIDKVTKDPIKAPAKVKALKYEEKLKRSCSRLNADFVSYDEQTGLWVFRVKHFSKYSCAPEEEEDDGVVGIEATKGTLGLGGKTIQQLKLASGGTQALIMDDIPPTTTTEATTFSSQLQQQLQPSSKSATFMEQSRPSIFSSLTDGGFTEPHVAGDYNYHDVSNRSKVSSGMLLESAFPSKDIDLEEIYNEEDKRGDEIPDYFGLMEYNMQTTTIATTEHVSLPPPLSTTTTTAYSSLSSKKLQHTKIPQHRKRDEIPFIDATKCPSKFQTLERFPQSNYRIGARVTFGPSGTFLHIVNKSKDRPRANHFIGQVKIDKLKPRREIINQDGDVDLYSIIITKQLSLMMNYSYPDDLFKLRPEGIIGELIKIFTEDVDLSKLEEKNQNTVKECKEELELWNLCNILWPSEELSENQLNDEGYLLEYRVRLGQWFKTNASLLFGTLYDPNDISLKGLLMKGMHYEACELAVQGGNFILALNLAQCCGESKKAMTLQMEEWINQEMTEFIPKDIFQIYRLCTGLPIWDDDVDLRNMTTSEWLQHFAIYLWYICPLECSIDEAVINYQALIQESYKERNFENGVDDDDDDDINFPSQHDSSIANTCIHLLKAYSCIGYPMKNILNPRANNPDCLDYKLSWFLLHNLTQFGYISDPELIEDLTVGLAGQLECMGLYQWAIYVLKTLPETVPRTVMIDRILERNVSLEKDRGSRLEFIEQFLGIPQSHIKAHCYKK